jgi:hypothetical protein
MDTVWRSPFCQLLEDETHPCIFDTVEREGIEIQDSLREELNQRQFAFIPVNKTKYFEQDALFGETVNRNFKAATQHIKSAGNSRADYDEHAALQQEV